MTIRLIEKNFNIIKKRTKGMEGVAGAGNLDKYADE